MGLSCGSYFVPKYHPRYSSVTKYKYYPILGKHSDRVIVDCKNKFSVFVNKIDQNITVGSIGAIYAEGKHSHGYYMVEFLFSLYTLQENKTIYGKMIYSGELVSNGRYFKPTISHSRWYVTPREEN